VTNIGLGVTLMLNVNSSYSNAPNTTPCIKLVYPLPGATLRKQMRIYWLENVILLAIESSNTTLSHVKIKTK
jgi:hypothetical protein